MNIGIVGAGLTGPGIAVTLAKSNHDVLLYSRSPGRLREAKAKIKLAISLLSKHHLVSPQDTILDRIGYTNDLEKFARCNWIIESIPEIFDEKLALFRKLEQITKSNTMLSTNTSGLSVTKLAEGITRRKMFLGTHFWVPTHLTPLVEIIATKYVDDAVTHTICETLESCGKKPVLLRSDIPGFVGNRLQYAMIREALAIVQRGAASPAEVDSIVKYGFGLRLPVIGPFETMDIAGIDTVSKVGGYLFADLENGNVVPQIVNEKVSKGELGLKTQKGFYIWNKEKIEKTLTKRDEELAARLLTLKNSKPSSQKRRR